MKLFVYTIGLLILIGCKSEAGQRLSKIKKRNKQLNEKLILDYKANEITSANNNYSLILYEQFVKTSSSVSLYGNISDVFYNDSSCYIDIASTIDDKLYFVRAKVPKTLEEKLKTKLIFKLYSPQKGQFVFKINSISPKNFVIDDKVGDIEYGGYAEIYFTDFSFKPVIIQADLIDFRIDEK